MITSSAKAITTSEKDRTHNATIVKVGKLDF